jgi:predicted TPR repeat methyltransferase
MTIQSTKELDQWHAKEDPWQYETSPDDLRRKAILLSELPHHDFNDVLDIGCGQGFVTRDLPGRHVTGVDVSAEAIDKARRIQREGLTFKQLSLFELAPPPENKYDLVVITGVLYPQYTGSALNLVYRIVDGLLAEGGYLISVHIDAWYRARFPLLLVKQHFYGYREYTHRLEVYVK